MTFRNPLPENLPWWPVMRRIWGEQVVGVWLGETAKRVIDRERGVVTLNVSEDPKEDPTP